MTMPASAPRAAVRSAVTVALWAMRVAAYVLHGLAAVLDVAALHADAARGVKVAPTPTAVPPLQPPLTP